ncbi:MAG: phosphoglycerate mutase [Bacteroidetes bacterium HGW-Bacteroidetes-17]|jgi:broad specificity phosphatase PhoE|nr:MAG: phosphoglycerate mutase [Bacteroidetes bacterium HGW-Bacteroidetes-17]
MKRLLLGIVIGLITLSLFSQEEHKELSTYYLIRHAEKQIVNNPNPELTDEGILRAEKWALIFKDIKFDAVYSTDYLRTIATAQPTAQSQNLEIFLYHPIKMDIKQFLKETEGKTVLMVGHSNTIPAFVNKLIEKEKYKDIPDENFGNLYIVEFSNNMITDKLLHLD